MTDSVRAGSSPARSSLPCSALADEALRERVLALGVPEGATARVVRFLASEVATSVDAALDGTFARDLVLEVLGEDAVASLEAKRLEQARVAAIRQSGLADLPPEALQTLLANSASGEV
jgi:hypothetical protein